MNWLVIKSDAQVNAGTPSFSEVVLSRHQMSPHIINSNEPIDDSVVEQYYRIFSQATHVIIADEKFAVSDAYPSKQAERQIFFLGMLFGRKVPVFSVTRTGFCLKNKAVRSFKTEQEMASVLENDFIALVRAEQRADSLQQLMCKGIPFTANCFADYIAKDKSDICSLFRFAGMDVNVRTDTGTPMLNIATRNEHIDMVEWLLANGADINAISRDRGYSAVMDAVWKKNEQLTALLISRGADLSFVSKEGLSIFVLAVGIGNIRICKLLAENGADPDIKDSMGMSAYEYAELFKNREIISILEKFHKDSGE